MRFATGECSNTVRRAPQTIWDFISFVAELTYSFRRCGFSEQHQHLGHRRRQRGLAGYFDRCDVVNRMSLPSYNVSTEWVIAYSPSHQGGYGAT